MTDSERQQILKMIADGKISAEEGLNLMQALGSEPDPDGDDASWPALLDADPSNLASDVSGFAAMDEQNEGQSETPRTDPDFDRKVNRFRSLWTIPLWLGVALTVVGAYWMFSSLQSTTGLGFWFYCSLVPFLLGVFITAAAFSSRTSRWIYVNVKQKPGQSPQRIVIAFPLSMVSWGVNLAARYIPERERGAVEEVLQAVMNSTRSTEPLMVDVTEKDGEHVQVYIG